MTETPKLIAALVKAQKSMKPAPKDSTNPHFRSKYASLNSVREAVMEAFGSCGLGFDWEVAGGPEGVRVKCVILHESGEKLVPSEWYFLPVPQANPQAFGSATTYGKRYTLEAAAGISTDEDDDANVATRPEYPPAPARAAPPREPTEGERIQAEPDQAGEDLGPIIPFGKNKGKRAGQLSLRELDWYIKAYRQNVEDPEKANFRKKNEAALAGLESIRQLKTEPAYGQPSALYPDHSHD